MSLQEADTALVNVKEATPSVRKPYGGRPWRRTGKKLIKQFNAAAANVKKLKYPPSDHDLLELYALFKQANLGDADPTMEENSSAWSLQSACRVKAPGIAEFSGKAKYGAWSKKRGMSREDAQKSYIAKVKSLIASIGLK